MPQRKLQVTFSKGVPSRVSGDIAPEHASQTIDVVPAEQVTSAADGLGAIGHAFLAYEHAPLADQPTYRAELIAKVREVVNGRIEAQPEPAVPVVAANALGEIVPRSTVTRTVGRKQWNELRPHGPEEECTVTVRPCRVYIESHDGRAQVNVYVHEDGVDLRLGNMQMVAKGGQVVLLRQRGPYPIVEWDVLFEIDLNASGPSASGSPEHAPSLRPEAALNQDDREASQ